MRLLYFDPRQPNPHSTQRCCLGPPRGLLGLYACVLFSLSKHSCSLQFSEVNTTITFSEAPESGTMVRSITPLALDKYPGARCIDGTPGAYYFLPQGSATFVLRLPGGGACASDTGCRLWASHLETAPQLDFDAPFMNLADANPRRNPLFANASMVSVHYCSGDCFSGQTIEPSNATLGFWFSGKNIVEAVVAELIDLHGLADANLVVIDGVSAGGIGGALLIDFVANMLAVTGSKARVVGNFVGGFTITQKGPYTGPLATPASIGLDSEFLRYEMTLWNMFVPKACASAYPGREWLCLIAEFNVATIQSDVFFTQSQTDSFKLVTQEGVPATVDIPPFLPSAQNFAIKWREEVKSIYTKARRPGVGMYLPACWTHTNFNGILIDGITAYNATARFLNGDRDIFLQDNGCDSVECNPTCP